MLVIDDEVCCVQPYLTEARGLDSPTIVLRRGPEPGLFAVYEQVFEAIWAQSCPI